MTDRMMLRARRLHGGCRGATVESGASYIVDEETLRTAKLAVTAFAGTLTAETRPDALIVACFGDPGVRELRQRVPYPVVGLAEASCRLACRMGERFAIVTGGLRWPPILEALIAESGLTRRLSGIRALDLTGDHIAQNPEATLGMVQEKIAEAQATGADSVILGGAGLTGFADRCQPSVAVPLLDSIDCAVIEARALVHQANVEAPGATRNY